jgi:hypothetical protein
MCPSRARNREVGSDTRGLGTVGQPDVGNTDRGCLGVRQLATWRRCPLDRVTAERVPTLCSAQALVLHEMKIPIRGTDTFAKIFHQGVFRPSPRGFVDDESLCRDL